MPLRIRRSRQAAEPPADDAPARTRHEAMHMTSRDTATATAPVAIGVDGAHAGWLAAFAYPVDVDPEGAIAEQVLRTRLELFENIGALADAVAGSGGADSLSTCPSGCTTRWPTGRATSARANCSGAGAAQSSRCRLGTCAPPPGIRRRSASSSGGTEDQPGRHGSERPGRRHHREGRRGGRVGSRAPRQRALAVRVPPRALLLRPQRRCRGRRVQALGRRPRAAPAARSCTLPRRRGAVGGRVVGTPRRPNSQTPRRLRGAQHRAGVRAGSPGAGWRRRTRHRGRADADAL
jgi:hypothetical protein